MNLHEKPFFVVPRRPPTNFPAFFVGAGCLLLGLWAAPAQTAPILKHTFEENENGWISGTPTGTVSLTHDAKNVKAGKGALQFGYGVRKGELNVLTLPIPDGALAKAKALRFWIKTDKASPIGLSLNEKDGGHYFAAFSVPKDKWQLVELAPADFALGEGPNDPKDPNNKLDMDKVESVGLVDVAQFFANLEGDFAKLLNIGEGAHTLYLDEFTITDEVLPKTYTSADGEVRLDTFARPQLAWMAIGDVQVSRVEGKPLEGAGMQAKYHQSPLKGGAPASIAGFVKAIPVGILTGATKLIFSAASLKPAKLIVQLEEKSGGKYNTTIDLPGGPDRAEFSASLAELTAAQDSKDDNDKLDLDQVKQLVIIDVTGWFGGADTDNTLWLNNFRAVKSK